MQGRGDWWERIELAALFFIQGAAMSMWAVPLTTVLEAHGLTEIRPYAYATGSMASFIAPLFFGAMADRHVAPVKVLRLLAMGSAAAMATASYAMGQGAPAWLVLTIIQVHALFSSPSWSIASAIVFSRLKEARRQFGPIRSMATLGWVAGCLVVSGLGADRSPLAGYSGALTWAGVAVLTFFLPAVDPAPSGGRTSWRQRFGLDALVLLTDRNHRGVFTTAALLNVALAAFYPFTPPHLRELGYERTSAWMALGQVTEMMAMLSLAGLLARWRIKWILAMGLGFGVLRYLFSAMDTRWGVLTGITLHGCSYTLVFITAQIYLDERVDVAWRARAQALLFLLTSGLGNMTGYLTSGWWFRVCGGAGGMNWTRFWGGLSGLVLLISLYFMWMYRGQGRRNEAAQIEGGSAG